MTVEGATNGAQTSEGQLMAVPVASETALAGRLFRGTMSRPHDCASDGINLQ